METADEKSGSKPMKLKYPFYLLLLAFLSRRLYAQASASNKPAEKLQPGQMPYFDAVPDPIEGFNRCS
jgi:ABC-type transporter lipoprotein component MlaA